MKIFKKPIFVSISPNAQADDVWLALKLMLMPWKWKKDKSCFCHSEFLNCKTIAGNEVDGLSSESKGLRSRNEFGMTNRCAICQFEKMLGEYLLSNCHSERSEESHRHRDPSVATLPQDDNCVSQVVTFESGRTALYAILMALGIKQGDEVLIQAFTCTAAVNPILWVGARPVYVDIEDGTYSGQDARYIEYSTSYNMSPDDLEKKITPECRVLIIQNTFGIPGKITELLEIARKNSLIVLEDCAHNLGAKYDNQKIGTFGEAAFFSFGRSKVISSVFGGAAFTKNQELAGKIREIHNKWQYPSRRWIVQQLFHPIYLVIAKPLYNFFNIGKLMIIIGKKLRLISIMVYSVEKSGGKPPFGPAKMPNALACLAVNQMKKVEKFNQHRREIAEFYRDNLNILKDKGILRFARDEKNCTAIFLNFPIQVKNFGIRWNCIKEARKKGIYLESWPAMDKKVVGPDNVNLEKLYYTEGMCSVAEKTAQTSINLPTSPNTTVRDAKRVINFIKKFFVIHKS